ncbi:GAF domain-containing protein [Streptomyces anandii]|uniref:GAF domain-containing protein n=1 Tax=Streptomyces anandii TaxID=285454 RepID=UPI0037034BFE
MNREQQLAEALVGLADCLADDADPVVLLDRLALQCVEITGADDVGIMMATARGHLRVMAVTDDQAAFFEFFQLQADEGPCLDCYREGRRIGAPDLEARGDRWPQVVSFARQRGYRGAHALPLRVGHQTIGAVNLLLHTPGGLPELDLILAQALADVTAVALVNWNPEPLRPSDITTRVQAAVAAKANVDIATGMLAEQGDLTLAQARGVLQAYATRTGRRLTDTAHALTSRALPADDVLTTRQTAP